MKRNPDNPTKPSAEGLKTSPALQDQKSPISAESYSDSELKLINIFRQCQIEESQFRECLNLYKDNKLQQLKEFPKKKYREQLIKLLNEVASHKQPQIDIQAQLLSILYENKITEKDQVQECLSLFKQNNISQLKEYPSRTYRLKFEKQIDQLLLRINSSKCVKKPSTDEQLRTLFIEVQIEEQEQIDQCLKLFEAKSLEELKEYPKKKYRAIFSAKLDQIVKQNQKDSSIKSNSKIQAKINSQKKEQIKKQESNSIEDILRMCKVPQNQHLNYLTCFKQRRFQVLLNFPREQRKLFLKFLQKQKYKIICESLEDTLKLLLTPFLSDDKIQETSTLIGKRKDLSELNEDVVNVIEQMLAQFQINLSLRYANNRTKKLIVNQLILKMNPKFILKQAIKLLKVEEEDQISIFYNNQIINPENFNLKAKEKYIFDLFEVRKYICRYANNQSEISMYPSRPLTEIKTVIFKQFISKVITNNEPQTMNEMKQTLIFHFKKKIIGQKQVSNQTLQSLENSEGNLNFIEVQMQLKLVLYFEGQKDEYPLSSKSILKDIKSIINQRYIPFDGQILIFIDEGFQINQGSQDQQVITSITKYYAIIIQLKNSLSYQYYGFHQNIPLTFESFSTCYFEDQVEIQKNITRCQFKEKQKNQQALFMKYFFLHLFSAMKKRFSLKIVIQKFKRLVSTIKYQTIWTPKLNTAPPLVNQSFVFAFMLNNSDRQLKIELMNLVKDSLPLPLYQRPFKSIAIPQKQIALNQQLIWLLKSGYIITSLGLHTNNVAQEKGKSTLLNKIFRTQFEISQSKHSIIKGIPYISLRVFQNLFPLHVIDIPHDCPPNITKEILQISHMVIVHSWKSEAQTEEALKYIKEQYQLPTICLIRDWKETINLKNLRNQIINEKPQKIQNISCSQTSRAYFNVINEQIFKFIKTTYNSTKNNINLYKGRKLYRQNKIFEQFIKLMESIPRKILQLTPVTDRVYKLKQMSQTNNIHPNQINQQQIKKIQEENNNDLAIQEENNNGLAKEIIDIVTFLISEKAKPFQRLLLKQMREQLKTYQNQSIIKFSKIYELRDIFKSIQEKKGLQRQKLMQSTIDELNSLVQLKPENIEKELQSLGKSIEIMINKFENIIKPKIFSIQLFWRELNLAIRLDDKITINEVPLIQILRQLKQTQISSNLPFQIIDGDVLQMPRKLMGRLFEDQNQRVIVMTILGPQSSGKSTLLNFLFGCDFATSQGRCTRGVYGTYFRFAEERGKFGLLNNCDGIFVIDTEGLFAITNQKDQKNKDRKDFDSKVVIFCLAVSDVVIVNVKGNFDKNSNRLLKLCNQRLEDLKISKEQRPQIVIVLNQNTSNKKDQSQNQFQQIRKHISFDISMSLSLAFQIKNYSQSDILILAKDQVLTKKYPQQSFLNQTTQLLNQIIKKIIKRNRISQLSQASQRFEKIWDMIIDFPNISKTTSKQCQNLEKKIRQWKQKHESDFKEVYDKKLSQFKPGKSDELKFFRQLQQIQQDILQKFDKEFNLRDEQDEDIANLIRQQKFKINSTKYHRMSTARSDIQSKKFQMQLKISKSRGNYLLKQKARQLIQQNDSFSEEKKRQFFDQYFEQQIKRIELNFKIQDKYNSLYQKIYDNYLFVIRQQTNSQKGLPKQIRIGLNDELGYCDMTQFLNLIQSKLIFQNCKMYQDAFQVTNFSPTDWTIDNKKETYFSMSSLFQTQPIYEIHTISPLNLLLTLNKNQIKRRYNSLLLQVQKDLDKSQKLHQIWTDINIQLRKIGLQFTQFRRFQALCHQKMSFKIPLFFKSLLFSYYTSQQIGYRFIGLRQSTREGQTISLDQISNSSHQDQGHNHQLGEYIIPLIQQKNKKMCCICSYYSKEPDNFLRQNFFKHINWSKVIQEYTKEQQPQLQIEKINKLLTNSINQDLQQVNLQIQGSYNWNNFINPQSKYYQKITCKAIVFQGTNYESFVKKLQQCKIINHSYFLHCISKQYKELSDKTSIDTKITILRNKNFRYCPVDKNWSLGSPQRITLQQIKKSDFKSMIFIEIKQKQKSFKKLFDKMSEIVQELTSSCKEISEKTNSHIYQAINNEISKFNKDLQKISCSLSDKFIGNLYQSTIYMVWKIAIDKKISEKKHLIELKNKEKDKQWQLFKDITSNNQASLIENEVIQFKSQFISILSALAQQKKKKIMNDHKKSYKLKINRQQIEDQMDDSIFKNQNSTQQVIVDYIQKPFNFIQNKFNHEQELSCKQVKDQYEKVNQADKIMEDFNKALRLLKKGFDNQYISEQKSTIEDLFELTDEKNSDNNQPQAKQYLKQSKRVLFEYLIDILISDGKNSRSCGNLTLKPKHQFKIDSVNIQVKKILLKLKQNKYLELSNLIKFLQLMLFKQQEQFRQRCLEKCKLSQQDIQIYRNQITTKVCSQQCPCCGRLCSQINHHNRHGSFAHQMRGFKGAYVLINKQKQALTIKCSQIGESSLIQYEQKSITWKQFNERQKHKSVGGWSFIDRTQHVQIKKQKIEEIWHKAGPIFCNKYNIKYVDLRDSISQRMHTGGLPIHYIFALDSSDSMKGNWYNRWPIWDSEYVWKELLRVLNKALDKIRKRNSQDRITIMTFDDKVLIPFQNSDPKKLQLPSLSLRGGKRNLNNVIQKAAAITKQYIKNSIVAFILMAEGTGDYPENGLKMLKKHKGSRFKYVGIQFYSQNNLMSKIASEMDGDCYRPKDAHQIQQIFEQCMQSFEPPKKS